MADANADQAVFWNSGPGRNWVRYQADLDANHAEITARLLAAAAPKPGENVLDIGCGAGGSTFRLAEAVGPSGRVDGLDISDPLLALAEDRRQALGLANVAFSAGDAQTAPLAAACYDLVASRFGMMFFADPVAAFRNLAAALRPGGRMVFVAWAGPETNPWFAVPQAAAVARLGPVAPSAPDAPGPMAFRDAPPVLGLLAAAGLVDARAEPADVAIHHPGGLDAIVRMCGEIGTLPRVLREKGGTEADKAAILAMVRTAFAPHVTAEGIRIPARVILYSARRP
jgi:SAM-dependent methyltransferase